VEGRDSSAVKISLRKIEIIVQQSQWFNGLLLALGRIFLLVCVLIGKENMKFAKRRRKTFKFHLLCISSKKIVIYS